MTRTWKVEDAKARLSDLIRQAQTGETQVITRRGKAAVVVMDADQYELRERSGWATFASAPAVQEFAPVRPSGKGRDIDPL